MKKGLLLGALLVLGTVANGAILETLAGKTATATVDVIVKGAVKTRVGDTLVVEITQGGNLSGQGFDLEMDDLFNEAGETSTKIGKYTAKVETGTGTPATITNTAYDTMDHKLTGPAITGGGIGSTTTNGVELKYVLSSLKDSAKLKDEGVITVTATTSSSTTVGTYLDATVALEVKVTVA